MIKLQLYLISGLSNRFIIVISQLIIIQSSFDSLHGSIVTHLLSQLLIIERVFVHGHHLKAHTRFVCQLLILTIVNSFFHVYRQLSVYIAIQCVYVQAILHNEFCKDVGKQIQRWQLKIMTKALQLCWYIASQLIYTV